MMNPQERLEAFWAGQRPDQIPYIIYWNEWRHTADDPAWQSLFDQGLRVTYQVCTAAEKTKNVQYREDCYEENGRKLTRRMMQTPVGEVYAVSEQGWMQKYWITTADDYRAMKYIAEHTELTSNYEKFEIKIKEVASRGIAHIMLGSRSPLTVM